MQLELNSVTRHFLVPCGVSWAINNLPLSSSEVEMQVWMSPHAQIKVMQTRGCLVAVVQTQDADSFCASTLIFVTPEELPSPTPFVALALSGVRRKCKTPALRLVFISVVCLQKVTVRVLLLSGWLLLASHPSAKSPWLPADPAQPAGVAEAPRPPYTSATGTSRSISWI